MKVRRDQFRLCARKVQQLFDQVMHAFDALVGMLQGTASCRNLAFQIVQMNLQRADGRAQFMRGMGSEMFFPLQCSCQAQQKPIGRADNLLQLGRRLRVVQGRQVITRLAIDLRTEFAQRCKAPTHQHPDQQCRNRQPEQQGDDRLQHNALRQGVANIRALCHHSPALPAHRYGQGAPAKAAEIGIAIALLERGNRRLRCRSRAQHGVISVPYLENKSLHATAQRLPHGFTGTQANENFR